MNENRSISIYIVAEQEIHFGDKVTLVAVLKGYDDCVFIAQWQVSSDNENWFDITGENMLTYTFEINSDNYANYWRIVIEITAVEVPDELIE